MIKPKNSSELGVYPAKNGEQGSELQEDKTSYVNNEEGDPTLVNDGFTVKPLCKQIFGAEAVKK